ncbi:MAG: hypothetical protein ACOC56_02345 [Atribacterota bacterium]
MASKQFYQPDKDAGWGLIYRLNALWEKADRRAESGDYNAWEIVLDRIFSNLLYRNEMEVIYKNDDEDDELVDIKPSEKDIKCWRIIKQKIKSAKNKKTQCFKKRDLRNVNLINEEIYQSIMMYDWWLRKFMQQHQLYLKEIERNPSQALFGGAFKKKLTME